MGHPAQGILSSSLGSPCSLPAAPNFINSEVMISLLNTRKSFCSYSTGKSSSSRCKPPGDIQPRAGNGTPALRPAHGAHGVLAGFCTVPSAVRFPDCGNARQAQTPGLCAQREATPAFLPLLSCTCLHRQCGFLPPDCWHPTTLGVSRTLPLRPAVPRAAQVLLCAVPCPTSH